MLMCWPLHTFCIFFCLTIMFVNTIFGVGCSNLSNENNTQKLLRYWQHLKIGKLLDWRQLLDKQETPFSKMPYKMVPTSSILSLKIGDHISFPIEDTPADHHALVVAVDVPTNLIKVIHFSSEENYGNISKILESHRPWSNSIRTASYSIKLNYSRLERIERAREVMKSTQQFGTYNLALNNCEHFVTYCTLNYAISPQIEKALLLSSNVAAKDYGPEKIYQ